MLLRELEYVRAGSVDEAVRLLASRDGARVLAGGQSLVNVMKTRVASPDVVVDLNRIPELREIRRGEGVLEIGAMATYEQIIAAADVRSLRPILADVASRIADVQVRSRGTIGGNLCSNDPTNHLPPVVAVTGATFTIRGLEAERQVDVADFFEGVYQTAVQEGELLTRLTIPARAAGQGDGWASTTLGRDGTGIVNVAASIAVEGGTVTDARVALGCVAAVPVRAAGVERALVGRPAEEEDVRAAVQGLGATLDPPADVHASADYRRHLAEVLAVRALLQAIRNATA